MRYFEVAAGRHRTTWSSAPWNAPRTPGARGARCWPRRCIYMAASHRTGRQGQRRAPPALAGPVGPVGGVELGPILPGYHPPGPPVGGRQPAGRAGIRPHGGGGPVALGQAIPSVTVR
jgi:hypothetical protein